ATPGRRSAAVGARRISTRPLIVPGRAADETDDDGTIALANDRSMTTATRTAGAPCVVRRSRCGVEVLATCSEPEDQLHGAQRRLSEQHPAVAPVALHRPFHH